VVPGKFLLEADVKGDHGQNGLDGQHVQPAVQEHRLGHVHVEQGQINALVHPLRLGSAIYKCRVNLHGPIGLNGPHVPKHVQDQGRVDVIGLIAVQGRDKMRKSAKVGTVHKNGVVGENGRHVHRLVVEGSPSGLGSVLGIIVMEKQMNMQHAIQISVLHQLTVVGVSMRKRRLKCLENASIKTLRSENQTALLHKAGVDHALEVILDLLKMLISLMLGTAKTSIVTTMQATSLK